MRQMNSMVIFGIRALSAGAAALAKHTLLAQLVLIWSLVGNLAVAQNISVQLVPDNGLQPRLIADAKGGIHLLYFKKRLDRPDAREGNLYYRQWQQDTGAFGNPVKVSSAAFPLQTVSISRAAIAIDGRGRAHVVWYRPKDNQYYYARSNEQRTEFSTQLEVVHEFSEGLDAGADIAALDDKVAIVWGAGDLSREFERTVFARYSEDGGATFGAEIQLGNPDLGACGCCSLATNFADQDSLVVAYRSALDGVGRHMQLLTVEGLSAGVSAAFYGETTDLQRWEASYCPLSTNDITLDQQGQAWLVFETQARVVQKLLTNTSLPTLVGEPFKETRQKNPAMAINNQGARLVVWAEAISHTKGGRLNMRLVDASGVDQTQPLEGEINLRDFSFPAAAALPDGSFLVLH
ncbi:MAG: hypothetical protein ACI95C_001674 [Pseudohongiellaceae bacterium]|jgi:hypothetical protein